ncbi:hypothetical protein U9M48_037286 [Paspalum notatum var. saurae]|uniref:Uncharacterized protein n=1 Tax=Paspalum notatum var. saurae TaxID=547442 RepID=A0AAQ3UFN9_PASNO
MYGPGSLARVADLKYGALQEIDGAIAKLEGETGDNLMLTETIVDPEQIAEVLDDGRLMYGQARTVDSRNDVIIMASNLGAVHLLAGMMGKKSMKVARHAGGTQRDAT